MAELDLSLLVLPGTIPGLLRRCSPVICRTRPWFWRGIYFGGKSGVAIVRPDEENCAFIDAVLEELDLDLTDTTGRNHAARWLGSKRGQPDGMAADLRRNHGSASVVLVVWAPGWQSAAWNSVEVPALADLDPADDRRLPDGSRWVDAEALRLVCLHVHAVNEASR